MRIISQLLLLLGCRWALYPSNHGEDRFAWGSTVFGPGKSPKWFFFHYARRSGSKTLEKSNGMPLNIHLSIFLYHETVSWTNLTAYKKYGPASECWHRDSEELEFLWELRGFKWITILFARGEGADWALMPITQRGTWVLWRPWIKKYLCPFRREFRALCDSRLIYAKRHCVCRPGFSVDRSCGDWGKMASLFLSGKSEGWLGGMREAEEEEKLDGGSWVANKS